MRIPFDIKYRPQIESGEYKVFAHEHEEQEARIVCWDNKGEYPIVAIIDNDPEKFDKHGRVPGGNRGGEFSLFLVTPEEELTEFEQQIENLLNLALSEGHAGTTIENTKRVAAELLELAEKELEEEVPEMEFIPIENTLEYKAGFRAGEAEALKDLPRWKKIRDNGCVDADGDTYTDCLCLLKRGYYQVMSSGTRVGGEIRYLSIRDLEKLPGFKED